MSSRPRIGVSVNFMHADPDRALFRGKALQYVESRMAASVWRAGGLPVILTELPGEDAATVSVENIDGLLLTGGADVSPTLYGQTPMEPNWSGDRHRDDYEAALLRASIVRNKPVFGICRGIQLINATLGGTLLQDIGTQRPSALVHRDWHRYDQLGHGVTVEANSWVAEQYGGATELSVNSIHHQALDQVADGFAVTARAPDDIIEAIEFIDDDRFIVAVQWHPEWLERDRVDSDPDANGWADGSVLFSAFVRQCVQANAD